MTHTLRRVSFIFFAFALFVMSPISLHAEGPEGLELIPAVFDEKVDPGKEYTFTLRVTNVSDVEKTFFLSTKDINGIDGGGKPQFATEGEPTVYNLSQWIVLPFESTSIGAGETISIPFKVVVPEDATPGGNFGGIFLESEPPRLRTIGAGVGVIVGSLLSMQVSGDIVEEARLRSFATENLVYAKLPTTFDARVENLGNTLIRPSGFVEIVDAFGQQVANLRINENAAAVFPYSDRTFNVSWEDEGLKIGRYQAILSLVYGGELRKTITASTAFWVLPVKLIGIILGVILLVVLGIFVLVKMYIGKKLKEMGVSSKNKAQAELYQKKYQRPLSRLTTIAVAILIFAGLFFVGILFLFA